MKKIIFLTLLPLILLADEESSFLEKIIENTNDYRKSIHNAIVNTSSYIDNYYFDEVLKNTEEYNSSYGLLELSSYINQSERVKFGQKIRLKLALPRLKDKIKLVFESDEQRDSQDYIENHTTNKKDKYNLSLLYNTYIKDSVKLRAKLGLKINKKFDPFIKLEAKKIWEKDSIDYILSQSFKQSVDKKLEAISYFEIIKKINNTLYASSYNEFYWNSPQKEVYEFYNSINLNQQASKKNYFTYKIDLNSDNYNSNMQTKRASFSIRYRHFIKKWLYVDFIPENYYKRENNFKANYAVRFNLGIYFNKSSYR